MRLGIILPFIIGNLLLLLGGQFIAVPRWLELASLLQLGGATLWLCTLQGRRERVLSESFRNEINVIEHDLAKAVRRYQSLIEGAGNAIFVFNAETLELEEVNRSGTELFGYSKAEFFVRQGRSLVHESEHEKFRSLLFRLKRNGRLDTETLTFQRKDGSLFPGEVDARLINLGDEQVLHCIVRDVTEPNRLLAELTWKTAELLRSHHLLEKSSHNLGLSEMKLKENLALVEQANRELTRLARMKNQFLGMVSHEFNTPLTSIISGADFLLAQGCDPGQEQVLAMVRDGGVRLKELVADLLKLVRLESRRAELNPSSLNLERSLEALKEQLRGSLEERRQTLKLTGLGRLPFFEADWNYLERVFSELLLNAIRFTPDGGEIEVTGRVVNGDSLLARRETLERFNPDFLARCGQRCFVEIEVRDNGIGIPPEEQQGIFGLFYEVGDIRHHSSAPGNFPGKGAGVGLAIVKGMVEAHGGMVWVESGAGSSFFVLLPMEREAVQPELF